MTKTTLLARIRSLTFVGFLFTMVIGIQQGVFADAVPCASGSPAMCSDGSYCGSGHNSYKCTGCSYTIATCATLKTQCNVDFCGGTEQEPQGVGNCDIPHSKFSCVCTGGNACLDDED